MPEAEEGLVGIDDARYDQRQERAQRHDVVTPSSPDEEDERSRQDGEHERLVQGHRVLDLSSAGPARTLARGM